MHQELATNVISFSTCLVCSHYSQHTAVKQCTGGSRMLRGHLQPWPGLHEKWCKVLPVMRTQSPVAAPCLSE